MSFDVKRNKIDAADAITSSNVKKKKEITYLESNRTRRRYRLTHLEVSK